MNPSIFLSLLWTSCSLRVPLVPPLSCISCTHAGSTRVVPGISSGGSSMARLPHMLPHKVAHMLAICSRALLTARRACHPQPLPQPRGFDAGSEWTCSKPRSASRSSSTCRCTFACEAPSISCIDEAMPWPTRMKRQKRPKRMSLSAHEDRARRDQNLGLVRAAVVARSASARSSGVWQEQGSMR